MESFPISEAVIPYESICIVYFILQGALHIPLKVQHEKYLS